MAKCKKKMIFIIIINFYLIINLKLDFYNVRDYVIFMNSILNVLNF